MKRLLPGIAACFLLIALTLIPFAAAQTGTKPLTIEDIVREGGLTGRAPETIEWSPDNTKVSFVQRSDSGEEGELWYVDAATGEKKILVSQAKLSSLAPPLSTIKDEREKERITRYHVASYVWAPDSKHLLFDSQGQLWLYALDGGSAAQLTSAAEPSSDPKFSPDGSHLAYLRNHNLFVKPLADGGERQLTKDTDENLLNGEVDWVYAEELEVRGNYFWSPDGKDIAFLQMDETHVPNYPIVNWMPTHPKLDMEKYPKAGDPNPTVRLGVISAAGGKPRWISLTDNADTYIPRFGWVGDGVMWAEVLNRAQDELDLYFVDARSGRTRKVLTESSPEGWIYIRDYFKVLASGDKFLWSSWRDGTTQLYLYSFDKANPLAVDAKLERQLTKGDFEVLPMESGVEAVDEAAGVVYFACNKGDARQRHLYSVKLDGSEMKRVSQEDGTHQINFADDGKHYVDQFSKVLTPPGMSVCSPGGSCRKFWDSRHVSEYGLIRPRQLEFKAEDGTTLYGELLLPPESAASDKIPLIVYVYGGPAAQEVRDGWMETRLLFHEVLVQKGFAIFCVDNRGTPNRDRKFQTAIRHEFGAVELRDQLSALDQLLAQYPQLDRSRTAIWGWSNGGSMTLYAMTHSDAFKAGVSVAPVTDWRDYDSIYTERYNGLPKDGGKGYDDLTAKSAGQLHGSLLLVHGTSDDNVHFQNSVQMVEALIEAGKQFRFMVYPSKTHGIRGPADQGHLFHMIEDHFERELKP